MPSPTLLRRHMGSALVAIPLTLWGLATIVTQLGRGGKIIRSCDPTGLIVPDWRFFAPFPAEHEYHLLYRDELANGTMTAWKEVNFGQHRRFIHLVWAPHRRMEKGLFDATSELLRVTDSTDDMRIIRLSTSYLALLNVVTHRVDHPSQARRTQFLVIRAAEYEPSLIPDPMFLSELHHLEAVR